MVIKINHLDEYTPSVNVPLCQGAKKISECVTDSFGDFKFDNIDRNSGIYTIKISLDDYEPKTIDIELVKSVNIGNIFLS